MVAVVDFDAGDLVGVSNVHLPPGGATGVSLSRVSAPANVSGADVSIHGSGSHLTVVSARTLYRGLVVCQVWTWICYGSGT